MDAKYFTTNAHVLNHECFAKNGISLILSSLIPHPQVLMVSLCLVCKPCPQMGFYPMDEFQWKISNKRQAIS